MIKLNRIFFVFLGFVFLTACQRSINSDVGVSDSTRSQAISVLKSVVINQPKWIKVHAAEYLLKLDYANDVHSLFKKEEKLHGGELQYRTGIWRILALASKGIEKQVWLDSISKVYEDPLSKDRIHAAEALAKLGKTPFEIDSNATKNILTGNDQILSVFTHWGIATSDKDVESQNSLPVVN